MKKRRRYSSWVAVGLICLAIGILSLELAGLTRIFRAKKVRDWAVELSFGTSQDQRDAAAHAIQRMGAKAVPELEQMLSAEPVFYRSVLVDFASWLPMKQQDAVLRSPRLVDAAGLRLSATRALGILGPQANSAIPALKSAIHDADSRIGFAAIVALGKVGDQALPVLTAALRDVDPDVRRNAALGIGLMGTNASSVIPLLVSRLKDPSALVGLAAMQALQTLKSHGAPVPYYSLPTTAQQLASEDFLLTRRVMLPALYNYACEQRDPEVLPVLTASLADGDAVLREWAAQSLGKMGVSGRHARPYLTSMLQDHERSVRIAVTNALNQIQRALESEQAASSARAQRA